MNKYIHSEADIYSLYEEATSLLSTKLSQDPTATRTLNQKYFQTNMVITLLSWYQLTLDEIIEIKAVDVTPTGIVGYEDIKFSAKALETFNYYKLITLSNSNKFVVAERDNCEMNVKSITQRFSIRKWYNYRECDEIRTLLSPPNAYRAALLSAVANVVVENSIDIALNHEEQRVSFKGFAPHLAKFNQAVRKYNFEDEEDYKRFVKFGYPIFYAFYIEHVDYLENHTEVVEEIPVEEVVPVVETPAVQQIAEAPTPVADNSEILAEIDSLEKDVLALIGRIAKLRNMIK